MKIAGKEVLYSHIQSSPTRGDVKNASLSTPSKWAHKEVRVNEVTEDQLLSGAIVRFSSPHLAL